MERLFEANVPRPYPSMTRTNCNYGDVGRTRRFIFDAVFPQTLGAVEKCAASTRYGWGRNDTPRHSDPVPQGSNNGKGARGVVLADRIDLLHDTFWRTVGLEAHRLIIAKARWVIGADIGIDVL